MQSSNEDYETGLDPKARETLELLRSNPGKEYTVMELYGSIYSEEEKSAHLHGSGGVREVFQEIQRWLNEFCELGHVKARRVSASFFYKACA